MRRGAIILMQKQNNWPADFFQGMSGNGIFDLDLDTLGGAAPEADATDAFDQSAVAVIGMACRMPAAKNTAEFWELISKGASAIIDFPAGRVKDIEGYLGSAGFGPDLHFKKGAFLDAIDQFDAAFFGFTPKDAALMDPRQRLFLQTAWQCLEDAGYGGARITGTSTGAYLGFSGGEEYRQLIIHSEPEMIPLSIPGNLPAITASRIAYLLDWNGSNLLVDTSCSSSLAALHVACQGIREGDCDMALAGSVKVNFFPLEMGKTGEIGIESSDGLTKTFDSRSDGASMGEGVICLLLRSLPKAISSGDHIYAVIRSTAVNQDGASIGITAPNQKAQTALIEKAWYKAGISPDQIGLMEAHGTATRLGDLTEVEALKRAFEKHTLQRQFCAIGSVKSNIGHLDTAAGVAGVLKACLALYHKQLPPTLHFQSPNPAIDFIESPFYVNEGLSAWQTQGKPRIAAVSSFGLSGTNCHVILEEAPVQSAQPHSAGARIMVLSAKTANALRTLLEKFRVFLEAHPQADPDAIAYTTCLGRWHYPHRLAFLYQDTAGLQALIHRACLQPEQVAENYFTSALADEIHHESAPDERSIGAKPDLEQLRRTAAAYVRGEEVNWNALFSWKDFRKISLPVYPFEEKRHWIKVPALKQTPAKDRFLFGISQLETDLIAAPPDDAETLLVLYPGPAGERIRKWHPSAYTAVPDASGDALVVPFTGEGFADLLEKMKDRQIGRIVYSGFLEDALPGPEELNRFVSGRLHDFFQLVKTWLLKKSGQQLHLTVYTHRAIAAGENNARVNPMNSMVAAMCKVIIQEYPEIHIRCIDIDMAETHDRAPAAYTTKQANRFFAIRNGKGYYAGISELSGLPGDAVRRPLPGDVFLLTGGTGGIGAEIALHLAEKYQATVILTGRKKLPEPAFWSADTDKDFGQAHLRLAALASSGSRIRYFRADAGSRAEMQELWIAVTAEYGKIDGIIHAAGIAGNGYLIRKHYADFEPVFAAKARGAAILHELAAGTPVKYFILFSSITAQLGAVGQSDYAAANAFLDGLSEYRRSQGLPVQVINWSGWEETGMLKRNGIREESVFQLLPTAAAMKAFDRALCSDEMQFIAGSLDMRYAGYWLDNNQVEIFPDPALAGYIAANQQRNARTAVPASVMAGLTGPDAVRSLLTDCWKEILGYDTIEPDAVFFEIGGDSLKLTKIHHRLGEWFPGKIAIGDLFRCATLSDMVSLVTDIVSEKNRKEVSAHVSDGADEDGLVEEVLALVKRDEITTDTAVKRILFSN